ncbi:MAG: hypothetical protein O8C66_13650 [Candidatus Methanoperedens sp.]|nr:hypothetical protein [Candidatus Methanoperedens sp.]MCZ7371543.1 hypothetical protein [Candidatus Methanoperedens sp.]
MSIRTILCFIILCFLPVASAGTYDIWSAKASGFIKSNESLSFENYRITAKALDNTRAEITVYRDQNQVEKSEFNVNQFKKYDIIGVTVLGINGDSTWLSISKLESKDIWRSVAQTQLKWGETYTIENYTFGIDTFGTDSVNLIISNKSMTETNALSINDIKDFGNLRIAVRDINRTGLVDLEIFTNKPPAIKAEISTDKNEYFPGETINVSTNISSDAIQNIVGIEMGSSQAAEILPETFSMTGFDGTRSFHSRITQMPANSTTTISAAIETRDYSNDAYLITVSKDVFINPEISIMKRVPPDTDDENVTIYLDINNSGSESRSIRIHDTVPEELIKKELDWNIELGPNNSTTLTYEVIPTKPGLYFLPAATAQWEGQSSSSKRMKMNMHMPYISMAKSSVDADGQTSVKLVMSNNGDRPAQVIVSDKIPEGYPLASGSTTWTGKLEAGGSTTLSYSLKGNAEVLPEAFATYRDILGVTRSVKSNAIAAITAGQTETSGKKESSTALKSDTSGVVSFMISSFAAIAGIIMSVTLIAYLVTEIKRRI